jgi:hypothetical protein
VNSRIYAWSCRFITNAPFCSNLYCDIYLLRPINPVTNPNPFYCYYLDRNNLVLEVRLIAHCWIFIRHTATLGKSSSDRGPSVENCDCTRRIESLGKRDDGLLKGDRGQIREVEGWRGRNGSRFGCLRRKSRQKWRPSIWRQIQKQRRP